MKKSTTAARLHYLMTSRNLKQIDILRAAEPYAAQFNIKMNRSDISQYVSGKVEPGQDKLTILGLALNVSEAWLMGYDVPAEREIPPITALRDGRTKEYVQLFELLNDDQKDMIIHAIKGILSGR